MVSLGLLYRLDFSSSDPLVATTQVIRFCKDSFPCLVDIFGANFGQLVIHNVGQDLASGTQCLATYNFGPAPQ